MSNSTRALPRVLEGLLVGAVVVLLLAACGGDESPRPRAAASATAEPDQPALTPGTCWSDQQLPDALGDDEFAEWLDRHARGDEELGEAMRDDAAFSEEVDCSEPHSLELYNVIALAPALTARIEEYADLLDQDSALYRAVRDQVNDRCLASSPYGVAERKAGGLPVQLGPSLSSGSGLHVAWDPFPADLWEQGQEKFVCTFEQDVPGTLRFADLTTRTLPVSARVCMDTPGKSRPCSRAHQAEDIAEMILNTAIKKGRISGPEAIRSGQRGRYVALTDAEYARLDRICRSFFSMVSSVKGGVEARAYPGSPAQWPTESGAYVARCFALKPFGPPIPRTTGTVFDRP